MVDVFTTALVDAIEKIPSPPRRHGKHDWCESVETLVAFNIAWTAREDVRQLFRAHSRDRTTWKTLKSACANLQEVLAAGLHEYLDQYLAETQ